MIKALVIALLAVCLAASDQTFAITLPTEFFVALLAVPVVGLLVAAFFAILEAL